jgi:hypothetical protein
MINYYILEKYILELFLNANLNNAISDLVAYPLPQYLGCTSHQIPHSLIEPSIFQNTILPTGSSVDNFDSINLHLTIGILLCRYIL